MMVARLVFADSGGGYGMVVVRDGSGVERGG